jgi:NADPH-dependent 2,4-dienoyl-CoA reductase/sulfur reductase-like enzyme
MPDPSVPHECDVLVVGGGPAGIAAAIELSAAGFAAALVEQGVALGGAIHRQPADASKGHPVALPQWQRLAKAVAASKFPVRTRCVFLGVDSNGLCLVEDRRGGAVSAVRASAVVLAVGAVEKVLPRPGTELPGVTTTGGLQVMLKETGRAPPGRILIAGNGPLNIALAAQLAGHGNPPLAVLETGTPLRRPVAASILVRHPRLWVEALGYLRMMRAAGVAVRQGTALAAIEKRGKELVAVTVGRDGATASMTVDHVALHDGIRPNSFGLPVTEDATDRRPFIVHAGDCREALGARSAEADGRRAACVVIARLRGVAPDVARLDAVVARERSAQRAIARLFAPTNRANEPAVWPADAMLCRCEQRSVGDLRALLAGNDIPSPREVKLNGRFCMGSCQGRFCADAVAELMALARPDAPRPLVTGFTGLRWPVRPASIASLIGGREPSTAKEEQGGLR